ncbi:hypothetical protein GW796_09450 [archaeon]|nr:hypothetical protein [archaeon]
MTEVQETEKKQVSVEEFEKRVESEAQNLMYFERLSEHKAFEVAHKYVGTKFKV